MKRLRDDDEGERGSVLLLTIGYAVLALLTVFVCVDATSLYLAQKRLDALADAAALAGADGFTLEIVEGVPVARLDDGGVRSQAEALIETVETDAVLVVADSPDGVSARVVIGGAWHPAIFSVFVPDGVALESESVSRTALG